MLWGWALDEICRHLEMVADGKVNRLLINVPPGMAKSLITSVFFPAWLWGPKGRSWMRIIGTSYDGGLATRDNVRMRDLIQSDLFRDLFPEAVVFKDDENLKTRFGTRAGGWRQSASTGAALTGHRGDLIIVDDPHSVKSAESMTKREEARRWFSETLPSRLNDPDKGAIVVIMQRLHTRDISGLILKAHADEYAVLCLPMEYEEDHPVKSTHAVDRRTEPGELLFPERYSAAAVAKLKNAFRALGFTYAEVGQLQQRPEPRGGGMFKEEDFRVISQAPDPRRIVAGPVRGWDLAGTADEAAAFTAGVKLALLDDGTIVVLDVVREQLESREVYSLISRIAARDGVGVPQDLPQDPGQAGKDQKRHLAAELAGFRSTFSPESGSKETRASVFASQASAGNVALVAAPWNDAFVGEATSFPVGEWKDQIDATSRAYAALLRLKASSPGKIAAPRLIRG